VCRRRDAARVGTREAEVQHLHVARRRDHHVAGLQIPVDDARFVSGDEHGRDLFGNPQFLRPVDPVLVRLLQVLAVDQFENEPVMFAGAQVVVRAADVGVIELGENPCFAEKARLGILIQASVDADRLQGDAALQRLVDGGIHFAHASGAKRVQDSIVGDPAVCCRRNGGHGLGRRASNT
jgi:hypothetical protein